MVQQVSYVYEKFPTNTILSLVGLNQTLVLLSQNMSMTLCRQKVTKQGKMCGFLTTVIEISAFAIFTRYENFSSRNWYPKAKAPISTVFFTLCPMS